MKTAPSGARAPIVQESVPPWPPVSEEIERSVHEALRDGSWGQYHGRPLGELVQRLQAWTGAPHAWPCSSGTVGVELALRGCGVRPGSEVILAGYDFPGNFRAIEATGATPVLVDVRPGGWTIDPGEIGNALSPLTSAVVASHLHGELADMEGIASICRSAGIAIVEDACQVPGARVQGRWAGTTGDAGVFSFGGSKPLTTGRGGAVITSSEPVLQRMRIAADRGNDAWPLSALQAAALLPQFDLLETMNAVRLSNARKLREAVRSIAAWSTLSQSWDDDHRPVFYKFPLRLPGAAERQEIIGALQAEGVPVDEGFRGFFQRTSNRCRKVGDLSHSRKAAAETALVHHTVLLGNETLIEQVCEALVHTGKKSPRTG